MSVPYCVSQDAGWPKPHMGASSKRAAPDQGKNQTCRPPLRRGLSRDTNMNMSARGESSPGARFDQGGYPIHGIEFSGGPDPYRREGRQVAETNRHAEARTLVPDCASWADSNKGR